MIVKERILDLVVEKTGYPKDMLDLDLDLEADLGVDTVKQAEMFAAIREIYNIPRDENRKLRDYPTLAHVIRFVYEQRPDLAGIGAHQRRCCPNASTSCANAPCRLRPQSHAPTTDSIKDKVLEIVAEKTGYPKDMLDLDLDLEADLGIDTVKQAEMFAAVRAAYNIPRDENLKLRDFPTLAHVIQFAQDRAAECASASAPPATDNATGATPPEPHLASAARQLRCGEQHSAPRAGADPAPAAQPVQADRRDARPGSRVVIMPDKGGVAERSGAAATDEGRRSAADRGRARSGCACQSSSRAGWLPARCRESTGCPRWTTKAPSADMDLRHLARSTASARQVALHHHAYSVRAGCNAGHLPGFCDTARRTARLRRSRSGCAAGRRCHRLHQDLQA